MVVGSTCLVAEGLWVWHAVALSQHLAETNLFFLYLDCQCIVTYLGSACLPAATPLQQSKVVYSVNPWWILTAQYSLRMGTIVLSDMVCAHARRHSACCEHMLLCHASSHTSDTCDCFGASSELAGGVHASNFFP